MLIKRSIFFLILVLLIIVPVIATKLFWIAGTKVTTGEMAFEGMGNALDQMRPTYSVIFFKNGKDTTWFDAAGTLNYKPGEAVPVRYSVNNPSDARVNTLLGIWAASLVYAGLPLLVMLAIFFHPHIVPRDHNIRLSKKKPVIMLEPA